MDPSRKRTIRFVVALSAAVLLAGALAYTSFSASTEARQPSELASAAPTPGKYILLIDDDDLLRGALVQSLVSEAPGQTLTRLQLLTADGANFGSRARLDVGKRRRSQSGRTHGDSSSNADATESEIAETLYTRRVTTKSGNRD